VEIGEDPILRDEETASGTGEMQTFDARRVQFGCGGTQCAGTGRGRGNSSALRGRHGGVGGDQ
jgi:hypothetical protein